ncbi:c-type cytochrome [Pontibacter anaerobius]|uniref:C-type cytochrome n=1 Tax=Pontibacter anaerobius TaxID=2993940 RepID=A0ABT3RFY5_9BACT|nr:c-type cytochrome [Pontibacter anaerobius]MCX2740346.1 c-type cytochrome [Pontibacter anaerobius]
MTTKHFFAALALGCILASCGTEKSEYDRYYEQDYRDSVATAKANEPAPAPAVKAPATAARKPAAEQPKQHPGAMLIAGSDCTACHSNNQKLVGPAYMDVANKYEDNDKNRNYLVGKVKEGGAGVWGQVPMPAHPNLSNADAGKMVDYILSLND